MFSYKIIFIFLLLFPAISFGQGYSISGKILDETDNSPLIGVSVVLSSTNDTTKKIGAVTDIEGDFQIADVESGSYVFKTTYVGFENYSRNVSVNQNVSLGTIKMKVLSTQLQNVLVTAQQIRAQQNGDTTNFNAGAFKTNPDATAEDLINKMPGISTEGGTIKANGEDVKQVLVDGKPFFGDDPNAAIKNLPAEIIDRIQVFDKLSNQSQLTGFDDGNSQKTINIVTKPGKNNGQFGKIFGGYGTTNEKFRDNLYLAGGNINYFKGATRVSVIALSNNVNQQNFSTDDLLGVVGTSSGQGKGGSRGGSRGGGSRRGGSYKGGGDAGNFLTNQQSGITKTNSIGLNYSDEWGKNIKVSGSYFFNNTNNNLINSLTRSYFTGGENALIYKENSTSNSKNINHRASLRLEYEIDSSNSIIFSPRVSFQNNETTNFLDGNTKLTDSTLVNSTTNKNTASNNGYNFSENLVYRHKFDKRGRSMSVAVNSQANNRVGDGSNYSSNAYNEVDSSGNPLITSTLLDQHYDLSSNNQTYGGNITYTEPISPQSQLMINYAPSFTTSKSDKETFNKNGDIYDARDTFLSNQYDNQYNTQKAGLSYRYNDKKYMFMVGANYQYASLNGMQQYPTSFSINRTFSNVLPQLMFNYKFSRTKNLRIMYRTNTNAPSIQQLQNVFDVSNPLLVKTGNADLRQNYQHTMIMRYGSTNTTTSTNFFALLYGSFIQDYIGNATIYPTKNIAIASDSSVLLTNGSQITRPVNLDGYFSGRSFLTYGFPIKTIKSNLNLTAGLNYNRLPALIKSATTYNDIFTEDNGVINIADNYTVNGGVVLSSNISENIDFTLSYTGYYNVVKNTIQTQSNNNYYNQNTSLKLNWIFLDRFVFNTTVTHSLYSGLSQGFNQSFLSWNAALGYKFLADRSLDVRLSAYDLLNQNRSIERTVTETYIEDSYTNVLQRYFMLNATYTLRKFGTSGSDKSKTTDLVEPAPERQRGGGGANRHDDNN